MAAKRMTKRSVKRGLIVVGIDPGKKGYFCIYDGSKILGMIRIPYLGDEVDNVQVRRIFLAFRKLGVGLVLIEEQHTFPRDRPHNAFVTGGNYLALKAALVWSGLRHEVTKPEEWKREAGIPVPSMPALELPPKPQKKSKLAAWTKKVKTLRERRLREKKKRRKDLAIRVAQEALPTYDFRTSTAWNAKPNDGKCESFLIARVAFNRLRSPTEA